ncbi:unnamed protein product [Rhodiola kirilowii]
MVKPNRSKSEVLKESNQRPKAKSLQKLSNHTNKEKELNPLARINHVLEEVMDQSYTSQKHSKTPLIRLFVYLTSTC